MVVCFTTGDVELSKHVSHEAFNITVSFGSVHSLIAVPATRGPVDSPEVRGVWTSRGIVRVCVGVEDPGFGRGLRARSRLRSLGGMTITSPINIIVFLPPCGGAAV